MRWCAVLLLLSACGAPSAWRLDSIAGADRPFDSSRLVCHPPFSHLSLELLRIGTEIQAFVYIDQHKFIPLKDDPSLTEICLTIDGEELREKIPLRRGHMRVRLSEEMTSSLILSLQEGKSVGILISDFQETISPDSFAAVYSKFLKGQTIFSNLIKGPIE